MVLQGSSKRGKFLSFELDKITYSLSGGPFDGFNYIIDPENWPDGYLHLLPGEDDQGRYYECYYEYDSVMNSFMFRGFNFDFEFNGYEL